MAKKKENELQYLQMPLPQGGKKGKMAKLDWSGINYRNTKDTGEISKELNISTHFAPFLTPSEVKKCVFDGKLIYLKKKGESTNSVTRWYTGKNSGDSIVYDNEEGKTRISVKIISNEIMTGCKSINNLFLIISRYDTLEPTEVNTGIFSGFETVRNYSYKILDENFAIKTEIITGRTKCDSFFEGNAIKFMAFENYVEITNINTFNKLLFVPAGYSIVLDNIVILDRKFDNPEYWGEDNKLTQEGRTAFNDYVDEKCTSETTQYYFSYAEELGERKLPFRDNDATGVISAETPWLYYFKTDKNYMEKRASSTYHIREKKFIDIFPKLLNAETGHQRLFGIDEGRVLASGYNDYANWALDTATEYSAENAWMSSTQSSDGGRNVGIVAYGGSVFVFKENSTLEIINTKNPFRINEIFSVGAVSQKGIQVVGNYLIFVSHDGVKLYNGASLKDIGYKLNIDRVNSVVSGTDGRKFYMSAEINDEGEKRLFVYDSLTGLWAEEDTGEETITIQVPVEDEKGNITGEKTEEITNQIEFVGFCNSDGGFLGLTSSGKVFKLDTKDYDHEWFIETDFFTNNSVDIKHIQKVQMLCDIAPGSSIRAYILYDDEEFNPETSHKIFERQNDTEKEIKIPIRVIPRRTANYGFKIRIEGYGFSKLYQMELGITGGGEKNITG